MLRKLLNNRIFQMIYKVIKYTLIALLLIYLAFVLLQRISNNSSIFGYRIFNVASPSMEPVYMVGDAVMVEVIDPNTLKVGDDLTYHGEQGDFAGKIITHRLIRVETDATGAKRYYTKGVANEAEDAPISEHQIYGKVSRRLTIVSTINKVVRNKFGFFFLVFLPLVLVVFLEIADTVMDTLETRKKKKEEDELI